MRSKLLIFLILSTSPISVGAAVLLDNTSGLNTANLSTSSQTTYGSNSPAYNRINGYTFQVGATSYDLTGVSIPIRWGGGGSVTPNIRIQLWELPDLTATAPAGGAAPFYTLDVATNTFNSTFQYFTFDLTGTTVNVKANTRYSMGFLTDLTTNSGLLQWNGFNPSGSKPSGSFGLSSVGSSGFFSTNGGSSFSASTMNYGFQLTGVEAGSGTSVPEATSPILLTMLGAGLVAHRRRTVV